jgi:hypothetical protein
MATKNSIGSGKPIEVPFGGTQNASFSPYAVLCGGTTSTGPLQQVAGLGASGQVLTSNGAASLPTWQDSGSSPEQPTYSGITAFTPEFSYAYGATGVTYSAQEGYYLRIGDMMYVWIHIALTNKGTPTVPQQSGLQVFVKNIPAVSAIPSTQRGPFGITGRIMNLASSPGAYFNPQLTVNPTNSSQRAITFIPYNNVAGTSLASYRFANISNTTELWLSGIYT